ncbi:hypothetical protein C2G38_2040018 [Gigaspora rosea]|uniref:Uncharacterized protein n=1 Tax=Gigaspora rosea TaxID=44941 RepID=A0A397UZ47_9GLOM|nr:hypothetical protein C2G38_2040018 [Gigaspora rosea]
MTIINQEIRRGDIEQIYAQNQYLYHLIKKINEDIKEMKAEVKRQRKEKESDLSSQVLDDVFTNVVKQLFPQHVYFSQSILKETLKSYLEEAYPEFMSNMSPNEFTNCFHSEWYSSLLLKMKNYRGAASQNVRHAIWRIFGSEKLPSFE